MALIPFENGPEALEDKLQAFWPISAYKTSALIAQWDMEQGSPVLTKKGEYTAREWTDWTMGFFIGSAILQFDATGEQDLLEWAKEAVKTVMPPFLTHYGVHDHAFNNVSTFGNLRRLMLEGRIPMDKWELSYLELALRVSGAVQASRWTRVNEFEGFIHSFNGAHSLFADTIRTCRSLALSNLLGQELRGEGESKVNLLERLVLHARTTAKYTIYYGDGRDFYDKPGRVCHESLFNPANGDYRAPSTQQGYSPFSTWTRALSWIILGFAELLEYVSSLDDSQLQPLGGRDEIEGFMVKAAKVTADYYIENSPTDGIPYWDTGAPGLAKLEGWRERASDPFNGMEPVDSSAAAIAAQGFLRLGNYFSANGADDMGREYTASGLAVLSTLLSEPYLCEDPDHQGLLLHGVYHRPCDWDEGPGEAVMWGDYHLREACLYVQRIIGNKPYLTFWGPVGA